MLPALPSLPASCTTLHTCTGGLAANSLCRASWLSNHPVFSTCAEGAAPWGSALPCLLQRCAPGHGGMLQAVMAGRAAEEIVFGCSTSYSMQDLEVGPACTHQRSLSAPATSWQLLHPSTHDAACLLRLLGGSCRHRHTAAVCLHKPQADRPAALVSPHCPCYTCCVPWSRPLG